MYESYKGNHDWQCPSSDGVLVGLTPIFSTLKRSLLFKCTQSDQLSERFGVAEAQRNLNS
jgi:hypothetical protein